jgi:hypothetical protein
MTTLTFDPSRDFFDVQEAIDLILTQAEPLVALKAIVDENITFNEFGFCAELLLHYSRLEC